MYKIIPWSPSLDLKEFYANAASRGFENNANQKMLVDSFNTEREKQVWILYCGDTAVGSVAAHSFDNVMGKNSYRIAARTCVFTDLLSGNYRNALRGISCITKNQNPTAQFLIPTCINWAPSGANLYITTNESEVGTQRLVHRIFGPSMEKTGQMKRIKDVEYRGALQTVWQLFPDKFFEILNKYPQWE